MDNWAGADAVYNRIKGKLKGKEGKIVAIDANSGDYFVGESVLEACKAAERKRPTGDFYCMRIGAKATYFVGAIAR